jgi:hypothetical protein
MQNSEIRKSVYSNKYLIIINKMMENISKKPMVLKVTNKPTCRTVFPLANKLEIHLGYKVLLNAPQFYRVSSCVGILNPQTTTYLDITYLAFLDEQSEKSHQFKFIFVPIPDALDATIGNLGNILMDNKRSVYQEIITVIKVYENSSDRIRDFTHLKTDTIQQNISQKQLQLQSLKDKTIETTDLIQKRSLDIASTKSKLQELRSKSLELEKEILIFVGDKDTIKNLPLPKVEQALSRILKTLDKLRIHRERIHNSAKIRSNMMSWSVFLIVGCIAYILIFK